MANVPYTPYATVTPQGATPRVGVNASEAAFGTNVAHAIEGLGKTGEQVSNELFARASAMQDLRNETEAREADAKAAIDMGNAHAEFSSLRGQAAVDGFKGYQAQLNTIRQSYRDGLSNDASRRLYDSSSLALMSRSIFNGAGHAAAENKSWAMQSAQSSMDAAKQGVLTGNYSDPRELQSALDKVDDASHTMSGLAGWDDQTAANNKFKARSGVLANYIENVSRKDPFAANQFLQANRQNLHYDDLQRAEKIVKGQLDTTGARNISDATNKGFPPNWGVHEMDLTVGIQDPLVRVTKEATKVLFDNGIRVSPDPHGGSRVAGKADDGRAIDLVPMVDGKPDYTASYDKIDEAMKAASEKLGIPVEQTGISGRYALPKDYNVSSAPKAVEEPLAKRVERAEAYARQLSPDDSTFHDYVRDRTRTDFLRAQADVRDQQFLNRNTVEGALVGNYGSIPTNVEQLKASDPRVAAAWDGLDEIQQRKYLKDLGRQHAVKDDLDEYQRLKGMAAASPEEFISQDIIANEKLSANTKKMFINLQQKYKNEPASDPKVGHAMQVLGPQLQAEGVLGDKDTRYQFLGALQDQLDLYYTEHKKSMPDKEIRELGSRLLQHQSGHWYTLGFGGTEPIFQVEVPDTEATKIKNDPYWASKGIFPTDQEIQRIYAAKRYQELYGSAKPAK